MGEIGNVGLRLDEDAIDAPEFGQIRGGNHAEDGVEVFIGEAGTVGVGAETEEGAIIVPDPLSRSISYACILII